MKWTANQIREFRTMGKLTNLHVSDRLIADRIKAKHARSGKITHGEGKGVKIQAYGYDELGNVCAIIQNGGVRQFIANPSEQFAGYFYR